MFPYTIKPYRQLAHLINCGLAPRSSSLYRLLSSVLSDLPTLHISRMAAKSDLETNAIRDTKPCLPSSALIPLISNPVQCDIVHRTNADGRRSVDLKPTIRKTRSPDINMNNKLCAWHLECLFCGCLPRASNKSESQQSRRGHLSHQSKYIASRGISPSSGSYNNNMQSESPATDNHEEEETLSSKDEEKSSPSLWSPFSRLRCYLAKRRRKNGATTLDGLATVSDLLNKDETVSKLSQPNDDLKDQRQTLLGPQKEFDRGKKCFIIDLDETLVHSSFKAVDKADFKVGVEIDNVVRQVYVLKRPHVDEFLRAMADIYECVLFTASLSKYADPVADFLDKWHVFRYRLFRESCVYHRGNYVKDLAQLGRPIEQVVILDNSPASYMFHAANAVQITSWFDDKTDKALLELIPYFQRLAEGDPGNVVEFLKNNPPPAQYAVVGSSDAGIIGPVGGPSGVLTRQTSDSRVNNNPFSSLALPSGVLPTLSPRNIGLPSDANPITSVAVDTDVGSSTKPHNAEDT